jgi:hypothetical protein
VRRGARRDRGRAPLLERLAARIAEVSAPIRVKGVIVEVRKLDPPVRPRGSRERPHRALTCRAGAYLGIGSNLGDRLGT